MARIYLGVGANIEPETHIRLALGRLAEVVRITGISTFYRTPAWGAVAQPPFINGVIAAETDAPPLVVKFDILRPIEHALGRRRGAEKYAPRPIDLDLLLYGGEVVKTETLTLPDPDIVVRPFLAIPLCELAPELRLPDGTSICAVAAAMSREHLEPSSGRTAGVSPARLPPAQLEPLPAFTALLRKELLHESPES